MIHEAECPHCGLNYEDLRTGETFASVRQQFWSGNEDPSTWVNKRRHTVLGRWYQIKQSMWREHLDMCEAQVEWEEEQARLELEFEAGDVPF